MKVKKADETSASSSAVNGQALSEISSIHNDELGELSAFSNMKSLFIKRGKDAAISEYGDMAREYVQNLEKEALQE